MSPLVVEGAAAAWRWEAGLPPPVDALEVRGKAEVAEDGPAGSYGA